MFVSSCERMNGHVELQWPHVCVTLCVCVCMIGSLDLFAGWSSVNYTQWKGDLYELQFHFK